MLGAFLGVTLLAVLAGAANTGTAMGVVQIAFVLATLFVIVRR